MKDPVIERLPRSIDRRVSQRCGVCAAMLDAGITIVASVPPSMQALARSFSVPS